MSIKGYMFAEKKEKNTMNKKLAKFGAASLLAVGAGTMLMKKNGMGTKNSQSKAQRQKELEEYRNTERGKQTKNSKGLIITV